MTAPDAARAAVRAELHEVLRARGHHDADELAGVLAPFTFVGLDRDGWAVVRQRGLWGAGTCRDCGRDVALTRFGRLWAHGPVDDRCDGSSTLPAPDTETENP